eukprot:2609451-Pleurochrysis_carterae.AAC.1
MFHAQCLNGNERAHPALFYANLATACPPPSLSDPFHRPICQSSCSSFGGGALAKLCQDSNNPGACRVAVAAL